MNQELQKRCELFIANKEALAKKFKLEDAGIISACSMVYTEKNVSVDMEKLTQCKDMVKKSTSVFSCFQGEARLLFISKMALADHPKAYFDKVMKIYDLLKKHKISGSEYAVIAAMAIADYDGNDNVDEIIEKITTLYATMKKKHPFLKSWKWMRT